MAKPQRATRNPGLRDARVPDAKVPDAMIRGGRIREGKIRRPHWSWRFLRAGTLALAQGLALASCTSVLSQLPASMGGLPEGTPPRPAATPPYPAVHDMPPPRATKVLSEEQRKKVEGELDAMRAEQARKAAAKGLPE